MRCKQCGAANPDWNPNQSPDMLRFCVQCGAELEPPEADAHSTAEAASSAAQAAGAAAAATTSASGARKTRSGPNKKFGGDLAPAATLGGEKPSSAPKPNRTADSDSGKYDWATHKTTTVPPKVDTPPKKSEPIYDPKPSPPKKRGVSGWLIFAVLVLLGWLGYRYIHIWEPATCEKPETCKICGETRGDVLEHDFEYDAYTEQQICSSCGKSYCEIEGHTWQDATCTDPKTCTLCGATEGSARGHDWAPATYDAPETCRVCGATQGNVLGWVGYVYSDYSDTKITLGNTSTYPLMFTDGSRTWRKFTVNFEISDVVGTPYGTWTVYVHSPSRGWYSVQDINISSADVDVMKSIPLTFPDGADIDGVDVVCAVANHSGYDWNWSMSVSVTEAQTV